ncbi:HNH endonuclease [Fimbriiglobus ruber]|uniref:HNH endonuclease n=1 Tax=Fimbriiglobus ruber TaxID=1908690 RepID=UPI0021BC9E97|nr:HNH endonuclease signature motif containing protein [Fimbriiglobus ruber]
MDSRPSACVRGYDRVWRSYRESVLCDTRRNQFPRGGPLCVLCQERGLIVEATEVDHITPFRGSVELQYDRLNVQSLCKPCHSRKTATEDRRQ